MRCEPVSERQRENQGLSREFPNQSLQKSGVACNQIYLGNQRKNANKRYGGGAHEGPSGQGQ